MIEIRHRRTRKVLLKTKSESLAGTDLSGLDLADGVFCFQDLHGADLNGANLSGADLVGVHMEGANLSHANLYRAFLEYTNMNNASLQGACLDEVKAHGVLLDGADLTGAHLIQADLTAASIVNATVVVADLAQANLTGAKLYDSDFTQANLEGTNLGYSKLIGTDFTASQLISVDFHGAEMTGAKFNGSSIAYARLSMLSTLHEAHGLEDIRHLTRSSLDAQTLRTSMPSLPRVFLKGVGYKDEEIDALVELYTTNVIEFYSCFLAHSKVDGRFADRLRVDLLANNVSCFHYAYDMRGGRLWRDQINRAIKVHDKLLVVGSREALNSENVVEEIITAIEEEDRHGIKKLFPIRLDNYLLEDEIAEESTSNFRAGKWRMDWVPRIRAYHASDFRKWKNHDSYERAFEKLLADIRTASRSSYSGRIVDCPG